MNKTFYSIWSEWDLGQDDKLFTTEQAAWEYATELYIDQGMQDSIEWTFKEARKHGLIQLTEHEVIA